MSCRRRPISFQILKVNALLTEISLLLEKEFSLPPPPPPLLLAHLSVLFYLLAYFLLYALWCFFYLPTHPVFFFLVFFFLIPYSFSLSHNASDTIPNVISSTSLSQPRRSVVAQIDRSAGREYNEKYIIHNGVLWVGDVEDTEKGTEASHDTLHFFLSQTKTVEEQVHSENTLPLAMLKIALRTTERLNDLGVRKEANKTSCYSKANSNHRKPAHTSETDVL
ncbi:uncharacterized protein Triagg1_3755 [Trichoderma aggressivum f. europaeum]|uniref:Uncharacterized protein n=1 Tax=Trichoderma aggressivum f. europaeum TaxID=173218 RepID=A0AAE1IFT1_9HYPO|nr:hypothetical protein Triagg1_3755 [Trichoderma aggressivum f. europaeum]